jgi:shikimate kinase
MSSQLRGLFVNIVLIGYRGSGKSTVGRSLAARLQMRFIDTDDLIEARHDAPISEIVKSQGWDHFRVIEKRIIEEISNEDNLVIAPGGGAVLDAENVMMLRKNGLIIWLKADWQTLRKRMDQDPRTFLRRPTLKGKGTSEELEEVVAYREPFYERAAEVRLDVAALDVEAVVESVLSIFQDRIGRV